MPVKKLVAFFGTWTLVLAVISAYIDDMSDVTVFCLSVAYPIYVFMLLLLCRRYQTVLMAATLPYVLLYSPLLFIHTGELYYLYGLIFAAIAFGAVRQKGIRAVLFSLEILSFAASSFFGRIYFDSRFISFLCVAFANVFVILFSRDLWDLYFRRVSDFENESNLLKNMNSELESETNRDTLTGLLNRRFFLSAEKHLIAMYEYDSSPFCLMSMDIDHFKGVNDTYGHDGGDAALVHLSKILTANVRTTDYVCRLGGDEFSILLRCDLNQAANIAEAIRKQVESSKCTKTGNFTVSIGVAQYRPGMSDVELYNAADRLLYSAKESRNKVCLNWN